MKLSTITLQEVKDLIPLQLTGRYSVVKFPVSRFNEISSHLEKYCDTNWLTDEVIIPMENGINEYVMDDRVRQPRGLYTIPDGSPLDANGAKVSPGSGALQPSIVPDKSNPIRFDVFRNSIRMAQTPSVSEPIHEDSRTIVSSTGSTLKKLFDVDVTGPLNVDEKLRGKAIIITHDNGNVDHLIIAANDDGENSLRVNGEMSVIPNNNTVYSIYNQYWILEYAIYLPRLAALEDTIDVPIDFEEVYRLGMFWHYYAQEGENKSEIDRYQSLFEQEKTRFCSDQNRWRSDNDITIPRAVPRMFPSMRN